MSTGITTATYISRVDINDTYIANTLQLIEGSS